MKDCLDFPIMYFQDLHPLEPTRPQSLPLSFKVYLQCLLFHGDCCEFTLHRAILSIFILMAIFWDSVVSPS